MKKQQPYNELVAELQQLVRKLESGEADIDESIKLYEQGTQIVQQLEQRLQEAENRITSLQATMEQAEAE